ncbi:MAG: iron-containing alcohol dehydrogenase, partial [Eubacteriales bacterium]
MYPFELRLPTKVVFGDNTVAKIGDIAGEYGQKAFVLTYDKELMQNIGIYQKVIDPLREKGIEVVEFFGVKSNPTVEHT